MTWLYFAITAYFLDAIIFVIDKYLLSKDVPHPSAYAFFTAALSGFALLLLPFGVHMPNFVDLLVALISGLSFFLGIIFLYKSVKMIDVTEAMPAIGAVTALATLVFSALFLSVTPTGPHELSAFVLLVSGTLMMSYFHLSSRVVWFIITAGVCMALSFVTMKLFFNLSDFINGLFWTRVGFLLGAGVIVLFPEPRREIKSVLHQASHESKFVFILNKALAGVVFIILYYAIRIGDVVFVNAIQGVQYVFTLVIASFLIKTMPRIFERHTEKFVSTRKIIATGFIIAGLVLLFI